MRISDWSSDVCSSDLSSENFHKSGRADSGSSDKAPRARICAPWGPWFRLRFSAQTSANQRRLDGPRESLRSIRLCVDTMLCPGLRSDNSFAIESFERVVKG